MPTTASIIEFEGAAIGYLQFYPWDEEAAYIAEVGITIPDGAWGLDIFIGEPSLVSQGIGSRTVRLISDHLFAEHRRHGRGPGDRGRQSPSPGGLCAGGDAGGRALPRHRHT